jgi:glycine cleavage system H protein
LTVFNPELLDDPSAINVDTYSVGRLFEIEGDGEGLLSADEYVDYLDEVWVATQRTIKGQLS